MKKFAVVLMVVAVYVIHQDFYLFKEYKPLAFGFLPVGLWFHGLFAILCAVMFWILGKTVWPKHLEEVEAQHKNDPDRGGH